MNALTQYIELYKQNRELLEDGSSPVMNSCRKEALEMLQNTELPKKGSENYETIDLNSLLSTDYGINLRRVNLNVNAVAPFRCGIPNLTQALFFLQNDIYSELKGAQERLPEGLYVGSLTKFCKEYPEKAGEYYGRMADIRNPLVALNTLLAQDGIVIWAKENVKADFPLQLVSILENSMPLMALRRVLIIAERGAHINLLMCDHTQTADVDFMNLQVVEIYCGEGAEINICEMEESTEQTVRLSSTYMAQDKGSVLTATGITLYNGVTRNEYSCRFRGEKATLNLRGMAIEDCKRMIDTYSVVEHTYPGCHTDELFKYVVDEDATGTFNGIIKVYKGAEKTEAYQNNRNIIGNDGARVYSKPRLEIYEDDVKCSHGTAIGQLDENQIFYMRTRGLSEEEARFLLKQAFMADVIESISLPDFRLRLHSLVEKRFAGVSNNCASCKTTCRNND